MVLSLSLIEESPHGTLGPFAQVSIFLMPQPRGCSCSSCLELCFLPPQLTRTAVSYRGSSCPRLRSATSYTPALVGVTSWAAFIRGCNLVLPVVHCLETVASCILSKCVLFVVGRLARSWFICHGQKQKPERHFMCSLEGSGQDRTQVPSLTMCPHGGVSSFPCSPFLLPGIASRMNYLYTGPSLRLCFGGKRLRYRVSVV